MLHGIILLGANGSGKSTVGRELVLALNFAHFDVEDYWFYKTYIPYTVIRLRSLSYSTYEDSHETYRKQGICTAG
jgi:cytidylate kinase